MWTYINNPQNLWPVDDYILVHLRVHKGNSICTACHVVYHTYTHVFQRPPIPLCKGCFRCKQQIIICRERERGSLLGQEFFCSLRYIILFSQDEKNDGWTSSCRSWGKLDRIYCEWCREKKGLVLIHWFCIFIPLLTASRNAFALKVLRKLAFKPLPFCHNVGEGMVLVKCRKKMER